MRSDLVIIDVSCPELEKGGSSLGLFELLKPASFGQGGGADTASDRNVASDSNQGEGG